MSKSSPSRSSPELQQRPSTVPRRSESHGNAASTDAHPADATTSSATYSPAVQVARDYYNSHDADQFYWQIWGGQDIHIGWYEQPDEAIADASRRTVETMAKRFRAKPGKQQVLLDLGAGYGGAARYLADCFGCHVIALNLSETENQRHRQLNRQAGLEEQIEVIDGDFENIPVPEMAVDYGWSQDAFLHSGRREQVLAEVARVLRPGGELIFTDPMAADDCPPGVLDPILQRIHLETLGSPGFYLETCQRLGLQPLAAFEDRTEHLVTHYSRVLRETQERQAELLESISAEYLERMQRGLQHWITGGQRGHLAWGLFHFVKQE